MSHHHHASHVAAEVAMDRRFVGTIVVNVVIAVAECVAGVMAGSLAMLSDAAHNFGDVAAIVLALVARKLGRRPPTNRHTYGFKRLEVMGALVNALLLVAVTVLIAREAIVRLLHPQPVAQGLIREGQPETSPAAIRGAYWDFGSAIAWRHPHLNRIQFPWR